MNISPTWAHTGFEQGFNSLLMDHEQYYVLYIFIHRRLLISQVGKVSKKLCCAGSRLKTKYWQHIPTYVYVFLIYSLCTQCPKPIKCTFCMYVIKSEKKILAWTVHGLITVTLHQFISGLNNNFQLLFLIHTVLCFYSN